MDLLRSAVGGALPTALFLIVCVLIEHVSPGRSYRWRDRFPGILFLLLAPGFAVVAAYPLSALWASIGIPPLFSVSSLPLAAQFFAVLLIYDFLRYLEHRLAHRYWWPIHAVHHSPTDLHVSNSYAHPLISLPEFFVVILPLSLIAKGPTFLVILMAVTFQNLVIHSPTRVHLGPLRRVVVDHRFHRIHHSVDPRHFGKNFGFVFTIWDQMFGTAYFPARDEYPDTGVAGLPPPESFAQWLMHPLRHLKSAESSAKAASSQSKIDTLAG